MNKKTFDIKLHCEPAKAKPKQAPAFEPSSAPACTSLSAGGRITPLLLFSAASSLNGPLPVADGDSQRGVHSHGDGVSILRVSANTTANETR